jgi:hypothetical protein
MSDPAAASLEVEALPCPGCGYDLRAMSTGRCPECGLEVDREALKESGVPWAHRAKIGRVKAYIRTVWWMLSGAKRLSMEAAKPQAPADARAIRRVTFVLLTLFVIVCYIATTQDDGLQPLVLRKPVNLFVTAYSATEAMMWDFALAWSAGATRPGVLLICLIGLTFSIVRSPATLFFTKKIDPSRREVGVTLATYAFSPIALLLPATATVWFVGKLAPWLDQSSFSHLTLPVQLIGSLVSFVLTASAVIGAIGRPIQWFARVTHAGVGGTVVAAIRWVYTVVGLTVFWLGLVPWCLGFLWIIVDSFRQ